MEKSEDQSLRVQICQKCYEHQHYDPHNQKQYQQSYQQLHKYAQQLNLTIIRNQPPKYLRKIANTKLSTKRYTDTNSGKIVEFPSKGAFEVYYKNILVYSKLQTGIFPDFCYLGKILRVVKECYEGNPAVLGYFQQFRDIQYQWKKNTKKVCQALYTYIRTQACGNDTEQYIKIILNQLMAKQLQNSQVNNKKVVHPYIIFDNKQKKHKIKNIYCPKSSLSQFITFTQRPTSSMPKPSPTSATNKEQMRSARPSTGICTGLKSCRDKNNVVGCSTYIKNNEQVKNYQQYPNNAVENQKYGPHSKYFWTQREAGVIRKNVNRNKIFELVIKEQNININQQKLKKLVKADRSIFDHNGKSTYQHIRQGPQSKDKDKDKDKEKKRFKGSSTNFRTSSFGKSVSKRQSKQVFVAYLNNIKQKNKQNTSKFQINLKRNLSKQIKNKDTVQKLQLIEQINGVQPYENLGSSSSRFGSIRKNKKPSQLQQQQITYYNQLQRQRQEQNMNVPQIQMSKIGKISRNIVKQNENGDNTYNVQDNRQESLSVISSTVRSPTRNNRCQKQSKYSRLKKSQDQNNSTIINNQQIYRNSAVEDSMNSPINQFIFQAQQKQAEQPQQPSSSQLQKTSSQSQLNNSVLSNMSALKRRASIEQATVTKRINQRKRSSIHQRNLQLLRNSTSASKISPLNGYQDDGSSSGDHQIMIGRKDGGIDCVVDNDDDGSEEFQGLDYDNQWKLYKESFVPNREPALIIRKFASPSNFIGYSSYQQKYEQIICSPNHPQVQFTITGQQLLHSFTIKSIQSLCKPTDLRLFPQIFKQIDNPPPTASLSNTITSSLSGLGCLSGLSPSPFNCDAATFQFHKSKLIYVVNLMLRSNPMMISRIFEDKKYINPHGVYCVWLRDLKGKFIPVFVNDEFAFEVIKDNETGRQIGHRAVYSWLSNQNSIWYMVLEKAVAKVVGGYHVVNELSLAQLMNIMMGSPTVDLGYVSPQKAHKIFDQKIFYNKMASVYTLRQNSSQNTERLTLKDGRRIDRIIGFSYNRRDQKQSAVHIKIQQSTLTITLRQFLLIYGQISLLFFNNNYFLNQTPLTISKNKREVLSCRLICNNAKNNCYLMFSQFPQKCQTKVTVYRQLSDQQAHIKQGMNPLSQQNRRYEYIGEISKTGQFFFEVQVNGGEYICLMESQYQRNPFFSIFSQYPIQIGQICSNQLKLNDADIKKMKTTNEKKKILDKNKNKNSKASVLRQQEQNIIPQTPKIIIQHKIPILNPKFYDQHKPKKMHNKVIDVSAGNKIKINKQYAYYIDNTYQCQDQEDQNNNANTKENKQNIQIHNNNRNRPTKNKKNNSKINESNAGINLSNIKQQDRSQKSSAVQYKCKINQQQNNQYSFLVQKNPQLQIPTKQSSIVHLHVQNRIINDYD